MEELTKRDVNTLSPQEFKEAYEIMKLKFKAENKGVIPLGILLDMIVKLGVLSKDKYIEFKQNIKI